MVKKLILAVKEGGVSGSGLLCRTSLLAFLFTRPVLAVLGEIRGGGPVWDVESGGTVGVLVADCQRPQSRARLKPETMTVTFEEFSPTHYFFDYTG
jgi:hypothetical protein